MSNRMYIWSIGGRTIIVDSKLIRWISVVGLFLVMTTIIVAVATTSARKTFISEKLAIELPAMPIEQLNNTLDFILDHVELANVDCVFGITMAEGQLNLALEILKQNNIDRGDLQKHLQQLVQKCAQIREGASSFMTFSSDDVEKIALTLLDPIIWQNRTRVYKGLVDTFKLNRTFEEIENFVYVGHPRENESDICIGSLLDGYNPTTRTRTSKCVIKEDCFKMMTNISREDENWGYATTHRLLYLMVGARVRCSSALGFTSGILLKIRENIFGVKKGLCSRIYSEVLNYYNVGVPIMAKDLFIEQIILCGIEGFVDFLQPRFLELVLSWQSTHHCFGLYVKHEDEIGLKYHRAKRESLRMPYDCDSHMTGLAATIMAVFIRSSIDDVLMQL